jgi:hypothetical protein
MLYVKIAQAQEVTHALNASKTIISCSADLLAFVKRLFFSKEVKKYACLVTFPAQHAMTQIHAIFVSQIESKFQPLISFANVQLDFSTIYSLHKNANHALIQIVWNVHQPSKAPAKYVLKITS